MDLSAFYNQFRDETAENVRLLSDGLLAMERMPDNRHPEYREQVDSIFRAVHTIKGSARLLGFESVGRLAHTMEHILGSVREGQRVLDSPLASDLLRGGDALLELANAAVAGLPVTVDVDLLVSRLGRGLDASLPAPPPDDTTALPVSVPGDQAGGMPPATSQSNGRGATMRQTVRVRVDRLDRLINLTGELALEYHVQAAHVQLLQELQGRMEQQERMLASLSTDLERLRPVATERTSIDQRLTEVWSAARQIRQTVRAQAEHLTAHNGHHGLLIDDLEREVMAVRLLPVSTVLAALPRAVRELSAELGKEVRLVVAGETTELDRKLLEAINDPLTHLIRNAIDHGIESPDQRVAMGKERIGTLSINASAIGGEVRITVSDDGRGVSSEAVRASAIRKGLISQAAAELLTDQETLELLFVPGFSTAPMITDISGRGVGLDVVRTNINELGGQALIDSHPGQGTTITLVLPLTLVTTRVVLVELSGMTYGMPASGCRSVIWTHPDMVQSIEGQACIHFGERTVPLLRLADLLGVAGRLSPDGDQRMPTLLIGTSQRLLGVIVDRLVDEREAVVKPVGPIFEQHRRYGGVLQLGDGQLVLMLNPLALVQEARGLAVGPRTSVVPPTRARLLVADDSFTTRELLRSILQSAGYDVSVAIDGANALDILRNGSFDLVVSDVEMPRVNGFQLTTRIRRELGMLDLPVIIITSLASERDRRQGLEAGAQAYIVKSEFNQDTLLNTIRQLLGR